MPYIERGGCTHSPPLLISFVPFLPIPNNVDLFHPIFHKGNMFDVKPVTGGICRQHPPTASQHSGTCRACNGLCYLSAVLLQVTDSDHADRLLCTTCAAQELGAMGVPPEMTVLLATRHTAEELELAVLNVESKADPAAKSSVAEEIASVLAAV